MLEMNGLNSLATTISAIGQATEDVIKKKPLPERQKVNQKIVEKPTHPQTPSNSRHSPLDIPLSSCPTTSPANRRFNTEIALALSVTPPIR